MRRFTADPFSVCANAAMLAGSVFAILASSNLAVTVEQCQHFAFRDWSPSVIAQIAPIDHRLDAARGGASADPAI